MRPDYDTVQIGFNLPAAAVRITRDDLVRYAGASGDFNPIHWSDRAATGVGLPQVIAHGMLTMGRALTVVTDWAGDPTALIECDVRFASPVPVPDDDTGATLTVRARVAEKRPDRTVRVELAVYLGDAEVLSRAFALVRLH